MYNRITRRFDYIVKIINHNTMEVLEEYDAYIIIGCEKDYTLADYISDHINLDSIAEIDVKDDNDVMIELLDGTFEEYVVTSIEDIEE